MKFNDNAIRGYAFKLLADYRQDDLSDAALAESFKGCVIPALPEWYPAIREEVAKIETERAAIFRADGDVFATIYECDPQVGGETVCAHLSNGWDWFYKSVSAAKISLADRGIPMVADIRIAAATLGRKGGSSKSLAKQVASRTNGKLGGRHKK
jgi:hypothetical protein